MSSKKAKLLESAQKNFLKGLYDKSIQEYRQLIQLDPADIKHRQKLAEILTKTNKKEEAISEYTALAKHYISSVHYLKAIAVYKQIQKLDSTNPEISLTLASLNEKQGLIGNASAEYAAAIRIFEANGEHLKALKALESMLAIDPDNYAVRLRVAEKNFSLGREEQAGNDFVSIARDLREKNDENGFTHVSGKIRLLFGAQSADLFSRINEGFEPEAPAKDPKSSSQATPQQQPTKADTPETIPKPAEMPVEAVKPVVQPKPDTANIKQNTTINQQVVVEELDELEEIEDLEELETADELEALEGLETTEDEGTLDGHEPAEEIEAEERLETAEELEEIEDMSAELPPIEESADWEEEIDLDAITTATGADSKTLPETDYDPSLEPYDELEDIELELEIGELDEEPTVSFTGGQSVDSLSASDDVSFDLGDHLPDFSDPSEAEQSVSIYDLPVDPLPDAATVSFDHEDYLPDLELETDAELTDAASTHPVDMLPDADAVSFDHGDYLPDLELETDAEVTEADSAQPVDILPDAAAVSSGHGNYLPDLELETDAELTDAVSAHLVDVQPDAAAASSDHGDYLPNLELETDVELTDAVSAHLVDVLPDAAAASSDHGDYLPDLELETDAEQSGFTPDLPGDNEDSFDLGKDLSFFAEEIDFNLRKNDTSFDLDSPLGYTKLELDNEDAESHYSLGLAYREMGLFNEAISEFIVASHSAERKIDCQILQAGCLREIGLAKKAIDMLSKALTSPELDEDKILGIKYELAMCHEAMENKPLAKQLYREILASRPEFSDTAVRFSKL